MTKTVTLKLSIPTGTFHSYRSPLVAALSVRERHGPSSFIQRGLTVYGPLCLIEALMSSSPTEVLLSFISGFPVPGSVHPSS